MEDLDEFAERHKAYLFRGQRSPDWILETSLERTAKRLACGVMDYERAVWGEFRRHAHSFLARVPADTCTVEWLALMQHYGAPTRLLDFTRSFWIALFFAFEEAESDCAVWALNPESLVPDSIGQDYNLILRKNMDSQLYRDDFLRNTVPFYTNERLAIQKGVFVYSMNLQRKFQDLVDESQKPIVKLTVNPGLFPQIRDKLNEFNCNSRVLFPGIDGYARYFKNHTT